MRKVLLILMGIVLIVLGLYGVIVWWWPFFWQVFLACLGPIIFLGGIIFLTLGLSDSSKSRKQIIDIPESDLEEEKK